MHNPIKTDQVSKKAQSTQYRSFHTKGGSPSLRKYFSTFQGILLYTLPLIFMSIAYYHIVKTLWRRNNLPGSQVSFTQCGNYRNLNFHIVDLRPRK